MFCKSISSVIAKNLLLSPFSTRDQLRGVKKRINTMESIRVQYRTPLSYWITPGKWTTRTYLWKSRYWEGKRAAFCARNIGFTALGRLWIIFAETSFPFKQTFLWETLAHDTNLKTVAYDCTSFIINIASCLIRKQCFLCWKHQRETRNIWKYCATKMFLNLLGNSFCLLGSTFFFPQQCATDKQGNIDRKHNASITMFPTVFS